MIVFIQTSDPGRVVKIPTTGPARIVPARPLGLRFDLANTLRPAAMAEARAVAARFGLRLHDVRRMAARPEVFF